MKLRSISSITLAALALALAPALALAQNYPVGGRVHQAAYHDHTPHAHNRTPVAHH